MEDILKQVQLGTLSVAEAKEKLATYENLGFAKIDHHREKRQGFPETIYGEGKSAEQINAIISAIRAKNHDVLVTRISKEKSIMVLGEHPDLVYNEQQRSFILNGKKKRIYKQDILQSFVRVLQIYV